MIHTPLNIAEIDIDAFTDEIENIKKNIYSSLSHQDFKHLQKIERYGKISTFFGYATAWIFPNPFSAFGISLGQFTRWLLAHHISHKGYDKVPGGPKRYTSKYFAMGKRRFVDWFDWLLPKAWEYEHNILHHYHTGEDDDPDLTEEHTEFIRTLPVPKFIKYIILFIVSCTWKFVYYAPNTMSVLNPEDDKRIKKDHILYITFKNIFDFRNRHVRDLWKRSYIPYVSFHFLIIPALFLPLGKTAVLYVFLNKILAEAFTNFHSFLVIAPNHTADDLYRYQFHYDNKKEFYLTQILGSANYHCGTEFKDYMCIWLNYQIEHHLFPDLPMTKYREVQPKIKALCLKYNIPYRQESIFKRFKRMIDVCVGNTKMREMEEFPVFN